MIRTFIIIITLSSSFVFAMDYPCYKLASSPVIDGKIDDTVWKNIPAATGFKDYGSGGFALRQSWFKAAYTNEALFIAVNIKEEDFETALCSLPRASKIMELDNCIHIKIKSPKGESVFTVNAANSRHSRIVSKAGLWSNFSSKIVRNENSWQLEIKIPFGKNLPKPQVGKPYGFFIGQFCRDDNRYALYATWGEEINFLWKDEAYKNKIVFLNTKATSSLCKRMEKKLNAKFSKYLKNGKKSSFNGEKLLDFYYKKRDLMGKNDDSVYKKMLIDLTK